MGPRICILSIIDSNTCSQQTTLKNSFRLGCKLMCGYEPNKGRFLFLRARASSPIRVKLDAPRERDVGEMKPVWSNKGERERVVALEWTWKRFHRNSSCLPKGLVLVVG